MVYDHWARASSSLTSLLTLDTCDSTRGSSTCISIDGNKTVIRMTGDTKDTNNHFRLLQDNIDWVLNKLVSQLT